MKELALQAIATAVKNISTEDLRIMFDVGDDMSPEAKQKIGREYQSLQRHCNTEMEPASLNLPPKALCRVKELDKNLIEELWTYCEGADIYNLLLTCEMFYNAVVESKWWQEQVKQELPDVPNFSLFDNLNRCNWRKLYLAYKDQWVPLEDEFWREDNLITFGHLESIPWMSRLPVSKFKNHRVLTNRDRIHLIGYTDECNKAKMLLSQIILWPRKGHCQCIWNEPIFMLEDISYIISTPPAEAKILSGQNGDLYSVITSDELQAIAFKNEVNLEVNGKNGKAWNTVISGTVGEVLSTIHKLLDIGESNYMTQGISKIGPHRYRLKLFSVSDVTKNDDFYALPDSRAQRAELEELIITR